MKALASIALAGVVSSAFGQTGVLNIVASESSVGMDGGFSTFTLSVYASADFGTHIAGGEFALVDGMGGSDVIVGMDATPVDWAAIGENDRGWAGGSDYTGLVFGQFIFLPPFPPAPESSFVSGETLIATIQVDFVQPQMFWQPVEFNLGAGLSSFVLEVFDETDGSLTQLFADDMLFGSTTVLVVPAPSSVIMLGLAGVIAGRRRR